MLDIFVKKPKFSVKFAIVFMSVVKLKAILMFVSLKLSLVKLVDWIFKEINNQLQVSNNETQLLKEKLNLINSNNNSASIIINENKLLKSDNDKLLKSSKKVQEINQDNVIKLTELQNKYEILTKE